MDYARHDGLRLGAAVITILILGRYLG